jgi:hypothetical protein
MGDLQSHTLLVLSVLKVFQNIYYISERKSVQEFMDKG